MSNGHFYNIDQLNKYNIQIPTKVHPEIVAGVLATLIAYERGFNSIDRIKRRYHTQLRINPIAQYEGTDLINEYSI